MKEDVHVTGDAAAASSAAAAGGGGYYGGDAAAASSAGTSLLCHSFILFEPFASQLIAHTSVLPVHGQPHVSMTTHAVLPTYSRNTMPKPGLACTSLVR